MKGTAGILALVSIAVLLGAAGCSTLPKSDSAALQGTWKGQENGPGAEGECSLVISGKHVEFRCGDEWYKGLFSLRENVNPKQVVFSITQWSAPEYPGKTVCALYRLENGTLRVAANEPDSPGAPASFDDPDTHAFVLSKK